MDKYLSKSQAQTELEGSPDPKRRHVQGTSHEESSSHVAEAAGKGSGEDTTAIAGGSRDPSITEGGGTHATERGKSSPAQTAVTGGFPTSMVQHMAEMFQQAGWQPPTTTLPTTTQTTCSSEDNQDTLEPGEIDNVDISHDDLSEELQAFGVEGAGVSEGDNFVSMIEDIVQQYESDEKLGEDFEPATANLLNKALRKAMSETHDKKLHEKYDRPGNCPSLTVPRVNSEVWSTLQRRTREMDNSLQKVQATLHKGLIPLGRLLTALQQKRDSANLVLALEAVQLLALSSFSLSTGRRQGMAMDFFPQYRALCGPSRPFNDHLFGDDQEVRAATKQIKEAQSNDLRLGYGSSGRGSQRGRLGARGRGHRGQFNPRGRGRGAFLGGKAPHPRRRGANNRQQAHQNGQQQTAQHSKQ